MIHYLNYDYEFPGVIGELILQIEFVAAGVFICHIIQLASLS